MCSFLVICTEYIEVQSTFRAHRLTLVSARGTKTNSGFNGVDSLFFNYSAFWCEKYL